VGVVMLAVFTGDGQIRNGTPWAESHAPAAIRRPAGGLS
jgi:hypothetical protein